MVKSAATSQPARLAFGTRSEPRPDKAALRELPPTATSLPTEVLFDDQADALRAVGNTYKAEFDQHGAAYVPYLDGADRNYPLHFSTRKAAVAGAELAIETAMPVRQGARVTFARGGLRETYDLLPRGIEQMFWFDQLPQRGELRVEVNLQTELVAQAHDGGFRFTNSYGTVTLGRAFAIDGNGDRIAVQTTLERGTLRFVVPAAFVAAAQLPLCIDPLVSSEQLAYQGLGTHPAEASDIAYEPSYGEYQVVFQRYWSGTDYDVFVRRFSAQMNPLTLHVIDTSTTESWQLPKIADLDRRPHRRRRHRHGRYTVLDRARRPRRSRRGRQDQPGRRRRPGLLRPDLLHRGLGTRLLTHRPRRAPEAGQRQRHPAQRRTDPGRRQQRLRQPARDLEVERRAAVCDTVLGCGLAAPFQPERRRHLRQPGAVGRHDHRADLHGRCTDRVAAASVDQLTDRRRRRRTLLPVRVR
jgi:hypothetical protein